MIFTCSVNIERPIDKVVALYKDPSNLKDYQEGFLRKELISGIEGEVGSISKMYYQQGKKEMIITETVLVNNLPEEFLGNYHHEHMDNTMRSSFIEIEDDHTHYITEIEYTAFRGFMPRLLALLFPRMFKNQVQKWLDNFKKLAESKID